VEFECLRVQVEMKKRYYKIINIAHEAVGVSRSVMFQEEIWDTNEQGI